MEDSKKLLRKVKKNINRVRQDSENINLLLKRLESVGDIILFGGAARDFFLKETPRDYDFVLDTTLEDITHLLEGFQYITNHFGGFKLYIDNTKVDLWLLNKTWAFRENIVTYRVQNLTKTVFFNADSIAINLSKNEVYDNGFTNALLSNKLNIVLEDNPFPELCVLRALYFKHFKFFDFSCDVNEYIFNWANNTNNPVNVLATLQEKHYGKKLFLESNLQNLLYYYIKE